MINHQKKQQIVVSLHQPAIIHTIANGSQYLRACVRIQNEFLAVIE